MICFVGQEEMIMINPFHKIELQRSVDIYLDDGIIANLADIIRAKTATENIVIVTDDNVVDLYGSIIEKNLIAGGYNTNIAVIKAGEKSKNINTVLELYKVFNGINIGRKDLIIALGGGVVGDTAGFAAATYMRGIPYMQVPTTLLAMIDSSIGGKTGIDLPFGKNLAGAFYQPEAIIIDPNLIVTLPEKVLNDGIAEGLKYGLIRDKWIFDTLSRGFSRDELAEMIRRSVKIKADIVEKDEKESNLRMILNYGHTFGHAIEKCYNYKDITHGAAISAGMVIAAKIGEQLNVTRMGLNLEIMQILNKYGLPTKAGVKKSQLINAIKSDKKRNGDKINFVLINDIGQAEIKVISIKGLGEFDYE